MVDLDEAGVSSFLKAASHARLDVDSAKGWDLTQDPRNLVGGGGEYCDDCGDDVDDQDNDQDDDGDYQGDDDDDHGTCMQSPRRSPSFLWFDLRCWSAISRNMSECWKDAIVSTI